MYKKLHNIILNICYHYDKSLKTLICYRVTKNEINSHRKVNSITGCSQYFYVYYRLFPKFSLAKDFLTAILNSQIV